MASSNNLSASITMTDQASAVLAKVRGEIERTNAQAVKGGTAASGFGASWLKTAAIAGTAYFALNKLADMIGDSVSAAMKEEQELTKLNTTLSNMGFGQASAEVSKFIDNLQYAASVTDSDLRVAFETLLRSTNDVTDAQDALQTALDISAGTGRDLSSVALSLARGFSGTTTGIGRLGTGIDKATLKAGDMTVIMGRLNAMFGGQAAKNADTLAGRIHTLAIAGDELKESFGKGFLDSLAGNKSSTKEAIQSLRDLQDSAQDIGTTVGTFIRGAVTITGGFIKVIQSMALEAAYRYEQVSIAINNAGNEVNDWLGIISDEEGATRRAASAARSAANDAAYATGMMEIHLDAGAKAILGMGGASDTAAGSVDTLGGSLDGMGADAEGATRKVTALSAAMDLLKTRAQQREALVGFSQATKDFIEKPSRDAALSMLSSYQSAFDAFKDGSKKQSQFVVDNYSTMRDAIKNSGLSKAAQRELLNPLKDAYAEAQKVLSTLQEITGRSWATTLQIQRKLTGNMPDLGTGAATGGYISGPGTGTSDSIPARLSNGEFVVRAAAVRAIGVDNLHSLNAMGYKSGGPVGKNIVNAVTSTAARLTDPSAVSWAMQQAAGRQTAEQRVQGSLDFRAEVEYVLNEQARNMADLLNDAAKERADIEKAAAQAAKEAADQAKRDAEELSRKQQLYIGIARDMLVQAKQTRDDYAKGIASNSIAYGSITGFSAGGSDWASLSARAPGSEGAGGPASAGGSISGYMRSRLDRVRSFGEVIKSLTMAGLNESTLREVIAAGPDQGTTLGQALLDAGVGEIGTINGLQASIEDAAGGLAAYSANTVYGAGVRDANGFYNSTVATQGGVDNTPLQVNLMLDGQTVVTQLLQIKRQRGGVSLGLA